MIEKPISVGDVVEDRSNNLYCIYEVNTFAKTCAAYRISDLSDLCKRNKPRLVYRWNYHPYIGKSSKKSNYVLPNDFIRVVKRETKLKLVWD